MKAAKTKAVEMQGPMEFDESSSTPLPPAPESRLRTLVNGFEQRFKTHALEAIGMAIVGAVLGFVVNFYFLAFRYQGFQVPRGAAATGRGNLISGSIFWLIGSAVLFGVIGYGRAVGVEQFKRDVREFPSAIRTMVKDDGDAAIVHALWGFAVAMLASVAVSPATGLVVAVGLLLSAPSFLGDVIAEVLRRGWSQVLKRFAPTSPNTTGSISMIVVVFGACAALIVSFLVAGTGIKVVMAVLAGGVAYALTNQGRAAASGVTVKAVLLLVGGAFVIGVFLAEPALADDGGWEECGATLEGYLKCAGVDVVAFYAALAAMASAIAAFLGSILGGLVGGLTNPTAGAGQPPPGPGQGPGEGPVGVRFEEPTLIHDKGLTAIFKGDWAYSPDADGNGTPGFVPIGEGGSGLNIGKHALGFCVLNTTELSSGATKFTDLAVAPGGAVAMQFSPTDVVIFHVSPDNQGFQAVLVDGTFEEAEAWVKGEGPPVPYTPMPAQPLPEPMTPY